MDIYRLVKTHLQIYLKSTTLVQNGIKLFELRNIMCIS